MADIVAPANPGPDGVGGILSFLTDSVGTGLRLLAAYPWIFFAVLLLLVIATIRYGIRGEGFIVLALAGASIGGLLAVGCLAQIFRLNPNAETGTTQADPVKPAPTTPTIADPPAPIDSHPAPANLTWLWVTLGVLAITVLILAGWWLAQNVRRARRNAAADQKKRRSVELERAAEWERYRKAVARIQTEYAAFESDMVRPLLWPALTDVRQPETAAFHTRLKAATDLDFEDVPARDEKITEFGEAVDQLETAWQTARRTAQQIGMRHQQYDVRRAVKKCIRLIDQSRDVRGNTAEARAAYAARAMEILGDLQTRGALTLPTAMLWEIEASTRLAIAA